MVTLSNGRKLVAGAGVVGIDEGLHVYDGYDAAMFTGDNVLTDNEKRDLANIMIARWTRFGRGY